MRITFASVLSLSNKIHCSFREKQWLIFNPRRFAARAENVIVSHSSCNEFCSRETKRSQTFYSKIYRFVFSTGENIGKEIKFSYWTESSPDNQGVGDNCVAVENGEWQDDLCLVEKEFICTNTSVSGGNRHVHVKKLVKIASAAVV